ncbi:MAG TPA: PQQ-binding-like beta-propeller repeat protein [Gammaproteobacteria bacterium]|nr:PQQ-binding-like beta-propeller repeat protein [Gammaproteobacteria bacterium]
MSRVPALLLFLSGCIAYGPAALAADAAASPLLGDWSGEIHERGESKHFGMRAAQELGHPPALYFTLNEGNIVDAGPVYFTLQDDGYKADLLYFHIKMLLSRDQKELQGTLSFDGNTLPFELSRGKLASAAPQPAPGRIAKPIWTFKSGGPIWSSPAAADGTVYFGSDDGAIYALDAKTGAQRWQFKTGGPVFGSPTLDGQDLYVLSDDGLLYKLDRASGKEVWSFDTHGGKVKREPYDRLSSRAVMAGGALYIGSANGTLYALDAASGKEKWHFAANGALRGSPAVAAGRVFFGSSDNNVYALDSGSGALLWQYDTFKPVVTTPLVAGTLVYVGSRSANLYAFEAATGRVKWRKFYWTSWVESSPRIRDGVLYIGSSDYTRLFALDGLTGREIWRFNTHGEAWPDPAVTDTLVYTGSVGYSGFPREAGFYAVDRATGKEVWRYPMHVAAPPVGNGVNSSPVVDTDRVYFGGLDGIFYAFPLNG